MAVDDVLDDCQTKTGTQPVAAFLTLDAVETFGQAWQVFPPNARPIVAHPDTGIVLMHIARVRVRDNGPRA